MEWDRDGTGQKTGGWNACSSCSTPDWKGLLCCYCACLQVEWKNGLGELCAIPLPDIGRKGPQFCGSPTIPHSPVLTSLPPQFPGVGRRQWNRAGNRPTSDPHPSRWVMPVPCYLPYSPFPITITPPPPTSYTPNHWRSSLGQARKKSLVLLPHRAITLFTPLQQPDRPFPLLPYQFRQFETDMLDFGLDRSDDDDDGAGLG